MKKNILFTTIFLGGFVNLYGVSYEISTHTGYNTTQNSAPLDHGYSYGIRMSKYINKNNAIGLAYNYMNEVEDKNSSKESNIHRTSLNIIHDFRTRYKEIKPYVFAGIGYEYIDNEYNDIASQTFVDYGVGIKYQINSYFNLSADMQAIHKLDSSEIDLLSSIGIGMVFGAQKKEEPKQISKVKELPTLQPQIKEKEEEEIVIETRPQKREEPKQISKVKELPTFQPQIKEKEEEEIVIEPKQQKRRITIIKRVVCNPIKPKPTYRGRYYVQLMTVFKTDLESHKLPIFKKLKKRDYRYHIRYPITAGKTSSTLVVGPYQTKDEAKFYLADLKSLKKDAYIVKFKR